MNLTVYTATGIGTSVFREAGLDVQPIENAKPGGLLAVPVGYARAQENARTLRDAAGILVILTREEDAQDLPIPSEIPVEFATEPLSSHHLKSLTLAVQLRDQVRSVRKERDAHLRRLKELNQIGIALSIERDPVRLFNMILKKSREITTADGGSLYLVEGDESGKRLRFKISQNDSMDLNYEEFVMPISKGSIAGYVAATGETLNIPDVYEIPAEREYSFNRQFDESTGYRTASVLAIPMKNHKGEIMGVIQLLNSKKDGAARLTRENFRQMIRGFDTDDEELVSSLASQAAVALDNIVLIRSIERLFEGFVTASVTAIESRDPTTSGHSFRVADLTVELARVVDRTETGKFRDLMFTPDEIKEIRYASLLHDFGKVGVRENVLVKAKKLYPLQLDLIRERFRHYRKAWEAEYYKSKLHMLETLGREHYEQQSHEMDLLFRNRMNSLEDYWNFIVESNEPTVLPQGNFERLLRMSAETDLLPPGVEDTLLNSEEVQLLSIRKGSLNDRERVEIESHVTHTFLFLSKIPWTTELKQVPRIAYGHHEKLNGRGYPNKLQAKEIPVQTRMMTISDIYDALTASDRPYKRAVPAEKALDIISSEVDSQQVDSDLFRLFVDAKIYSVTAGK